MNMRSNLKFASLLSNELLIILLNLLRQLTVLCTRYACSYIAVRVSSWEGGVGPWGWDGGDVPYTIANHLPVVQNGRSLWSHSTCTGRVAIIATCICLPHEQNPRISTWPVTSQNQFGVCSTSGKTSHSIHKLWPYSN